ncbi:MAG: hypothetical protein ACHQUC_08720 [Chlamydiales bacterium]|jgi:hypothetical protein
MNTPPQKTKTEMNRLHITQPRSDVDIEDFIYLDSLQMELAKSDLYVEYKQAIKTLRHALHKQYIQFENSANQAFVKEVFYRIMEESLAYLGDLREGTFFAANHHARALLELNATVEYVLSKAGKENKFIERFHLYPHLAFHKVFHQHDDAFLKLSEDICKEFFSDYNELRPEIFDAFGKKNEEKLLKLSCWQGNAKIADLFAMCTYPEIIKADYAKLCLFTHISSLCRRSEIEVLPKFCKNNERMLLLTVRYAVFSYLSIKQEGLLDFVTQDKLDGIFLSLSNVLSKSHEALGYKALSKQP